MSTLSEGVRNLVKSLCPEGRALSRDELIRLHDLLNENRPGLLGLWGSTETVFDKDTLAFSYNYANQGENTRLGVILKSPYSILWRWKDSSVFADEVTFYPVVRADYNHGPKGDGILSLLSTQLILLDKKEFEPKPMPFKDRLVVFSDSSGTNKLLTQVEAKAEMDALDAAIEASRNI